MKKKFDVHKIPAPVTLFEKIILVLGIGAAIFVGVSLFITVIKMFTNHGN